MKCHFLSFSLFVLFSFVLTNVSYAQNSVCGEGCLGTWCYVDVSLSDPTNAGELIYTIPMPPERFTGGIMGPGSPYLFNNLGNTIELHLKRGQLVVEADGGNVQLVLDALVDKYVIATEGSVSSGDYAQCHYHIILNVTQ